MYINRDDKSIFLMILAILIISLIAFASVIGIVWNIISPGVNQVVSLFSTTVKNSNIDYNFYVPSKSEALITVTGTDPIVVEVDTNNSSEGSFNQVIPDPVVITDKDYNFATPEFDFTKVEGIQNYYEIVRDDAKSLDNIFQPKFGESAKIQIPKIKLDSPIIEEGEGERAMMSGFWVYQNLDDKQFPDSSIILTAYRRYFDSTDPRSLYYINYLTINDKITIFSDNNEYIYRITGYNEFGSEFDVYSETMDSSTLKIVTSSLDGTLRYVLTAKRI